MKKQSIKFLVLAVLAITLKISAGPIPEDHFVKIPKNTFKMGNSFDKQRWYTKPVHEVTLDSFYICKYETTNAQYAEFLNEALNASKIFISNKIAYGIEDKEKQCPFFLAYIEGENYSPLIYQNGTFKVRKRDGLNMDKHPVFMVSWYGAKAFCDYYCYKLPTEAQWECAARGGYEGFKYSWGSNKMHSSKCNYNANNPLNLSEYPFTVPVDYYKPWGQYKLHCMVANVSEWCQDYYSESYYYDISGKGPIENPQGPARTDSQSVRGGAWYSYDIFCRIGFRFYDYPEHAYIFTGFRVCK